MLNFIIEYLVEKLYVRITIKVKIFRMWDYPHNVWVVSFRLVQSINL